ncbi:hypothetical protein [Fusicatenibacter sp.]
MEKMKWTRPEVAGELFEANEYVAACITGVIQCAYPGNGKTNGKTDRFDDYNGKESGYYRDSQGMLHGLCGNDAKISFNGDTGTGYEYIGNQIQRNRPIYNIKGYEAKAGTYYGVQWNSDDGDNHSGTYSHIGRLVITDIDSSHPNHS